MSTNHNNIESNESRPARFDAIGPKYYYVQYEFLPDAACYVSSGFRLFSTYADACDWVRSQKRLAHAGINDIAVEVRQ